MNKQIIDILTQWKYECKATTILQFKMSYSTGILIIYTSQPGYFIGKAGCYFNKYTEMFKEEFSGFNNIEIVEVDNYVIN